MLNYEVRFGGTIERREGVPGDRRRRRDSRGLKIHLDDGRNTSTLIILGARQGHKSEQHLRSPGTNLVVRFSSCFKRK